eukprot:CCRYP_006263-RA/>CCRYP_006263-RA protein AED:0.06 eAED:0.06 QI:392/1/1/1/0/0/3/89/412
MGTSPPQRMAPPLQAQKPTQAPTTSNAQPWPVSNNSLAVEKYRQTHERCMGHSSNLGGTHVERNHVNNNGTLPHPSNSIAGNIPTKTTPQSILHTRKHPQQTAYAMEDSPPEVAPHNRVRFLSSNSSVASSTCASEVHLLAGPGSVASSSAMSSSRGDAENVFDKVLHMVMAEEEDRLKAMGMSKAGSFAASQSPAMYYKSKNSPAMYYSGGIGGSTSYESEGRSPRGMVPDGKSKMAAAGTLIDVDTGVKLDSIGNIECEYHDLNDGAIDERKFRDLLGQSSLGTHLHDSVASGVSDRALNGSATSFDGHLPSDRRSRSNDSRQHQQHPPLQYRKYASQGSENAATPQQRHQNAWPNQSVDAQINSSALHSGKQVSPAKKEADRPVATASPSKQKGPWVGFGKEGFAFRQG